jgi:hypothetical protein
MLSQIGYLGAILSPSDQQIRMLSEEIGNFVKGGLNIAKARITGSIDAGGLGMIDVQSYVVSLQAAWFKKINGNICDNWRLDISTAANGNIFAIDPAELRKTGSVVATGIAESFSKVRYEFIKSDNNLLDSFLVNNSLLKRFETNGSVLAIIKNNVPRIDMERIFKLKIADFWSGGLKTLDEICMDTGINFSLVTYMRLSGIISAGCGRFGPVRIPDPPQKNIINLFSGTRKGSRAIRNALDKSKHDVEITKLSRLRQVNTFFNLIGVPVPVPDMLKKIYGSWGWYFLPNKTRDFAFKFFNNMLGLNTRLAHFVEQRRACDLCGGRRGGGPVPVPVAQQPEETFLHLFFTCTVTNNFRNQFLNVLMDTLVILNDADKKLFWFCGLIPDRKKDFLGLHTLTIFINEYIWACKLKKTSLSLHSLMLDLDTAMRTAMMANRKMLLRCQKIDLPIFRRWCRWEEPNGEEEEEEE